MGNSTEVAQCKEYVNSFSSFFFDFLEKTVNPWPNAVPLHVLFPTRAKRNKKSVKQIGDERA